MGLNNMAKKRYLTKSRFNLATECPAKLFYTGKADYANQKLDDNFLLALADGGFQVGELAKCYFPGGHDITTLDYDLALSQTNELLKQEKVIICEAAIATENLFIRADILVKHGEHLALYEVKSKSYDPSDKDSFYNKDETFKSKWKPYLYDVAFQKHAISLAFPKYSVSACLMMADKKALCPTEGLNQKFRLKKDKNGRRHVSVSDKLNDDDLTPPILCKVNVDLECEKIYQGTDSKEKRDLSFAAQINKFAEYYSLDEKIDYPISTACKKCEFYATEEEEQRGLKNGKNECWKKQLGWSDKDFSYSTVLDIWNFQRKDKLLQSSIIKLSDVTEEDISPKSDKKQGVSASERQWLQVEKYQAQDNSVWMDRDNLLMEMEGWVFPLHFIDFETAMAAIPFNKGRRPYEGIAFQFSHHVVYEDGSVEHRGEYLNIKQGVFPNYDFIRALKSELDKDLGSIFRYASHENSYLNKIYQQLQADVSEIEDRNELCEFIKTISKSKKDSDEIWTGARNMIDMLEIIKRYYYDPATNGSNSIKQVLPAMLNSSKYLQEKYAKPIYGAPGEIKSLNFNDWRWIQYDEEQNIIDPYKLLPKIFADVSDSELQILCYGSNLYDDDQLCNGGAALTAYIRMQSEEMSDYERKEINKALLKYCELDTMAMVMIYEGWRELLK